MRHLDVVANLGPERDARYRIHLTYTLFRNGTPIRRTMTWSTANVGVLAECLREHRWLPQSVCVLKVEGEQEAVGMFTAAWVANELTRA